MEEKIEEEILKNPAATARLILNSDDRDRLIGNLLKIVIPPIIKMIKMINI